MRSIGSPERPIHGCHGPGMTGPDNLPPEAYAAALADLPGIGPARLVALLRDASPEMVWQRVLSGDVRRPEPSPGSRRTGYRAAWAEVATRRNIDRRWDEIRKAKIRVAYLNGPEFPAALAGDAEPPGVLFWIGDLAVLDRPCVAIVGTRQCTGYGRAVATELGHDLADCGVCVVSGLALGIDGAAHQGALTAVAATGPLGVAASAVDRPYPRRHAELWVRVAASGAVISEAAPGQPAQSWRFPARNRLIAALARVVVVVESHVAGGSMLTVAAAADRGVEVLAVPGPVNSPASIGTNQLLHEGVGPARHAGDVLAALGDLRSWPPPARPAATSTSAASRSSGSKIRQRSSTVNGSGTPLPESMAPGQGAPVPPARGRNLGTPELRVLRSIDRTPTPTSLIADRTGLPIGPLSVVLLHLEGLGVVRGEGAWWERCDGE
ncbi:MAG: processing protein [Acidimicrobiaceae bacterium]|nr:processing protein [Acidimicrobiaceae bacterium]